ncbi:MAG TPA: RDD family protein [Caulobacteraceae bacterium]|nr:RDD family protein [Caulobacteraceae bacterium]
MAEQNYGGFWIRFLALVVDSLIVGIGFFLIVTLLGVMGLELFSPELILFVMGLLYWAFMQASARQATYGKSLVGLKVTGSNGERLSIARALAREVAKILSSLTFLIGYVLAAFTKRKQALHDLIASTYVVRAEPGHVVAALAVALVALFAPVIVVLFFGVGLVAGMMGGLAGAMLGGPQITLQAPTPPAPKAPPIAKPQAVVQAPATPAKPTPAVMAPPAAPAVVLAQAPAKEPAKPMAKEEPAKPVAAEPAKEAPKPLAKKQRAKPAATELAKEAAKPVEPRKPEPMAAPGQAPMQTAAAPAGSGPRFNDLMTAVLYRDAKAVNELLAYGKWADKPDSRGMTPLMLAAMLGDAPIAEALLKAGANPSRPGPGGDTAISIARERKDTGMLGLLQSRGGK